MQYSFFYVILSSAKIFCKEVDFNGTKTVVNAIKRYNPECFMLYSSSTSVYGRVEDYKNIDKI